MVRHVILMGLRGCGKSTLGRSAAAALAWPFVDLDDHTPKVLGASSVAEAFTKHGQPAFRKAEATALEAVLRTATTPVVLALGGGTPTAPGADALLKNAQRHGALLVYLRAGEATLRARLAQADNAHRPSLTGNDPLLEIGPVLAQRDPLYLDLASDVVNVDGLGESAVVEKLLALARGE
jgi:shikimate kinase